MDLSGVAFVATIQKPGENLSLVLHNNQRVSAQILRVADGEVLLSINGMKIVARLSSTDQAATLLKQQMVQFLVKSVSQQSVQLQLVSPQMGQSTLPSTLTPSALQDLSRALLNNIGLQINNTNLLLAQALVERGMNVTPELIRNLSNLLGQLGKWGKSELDNAFLLHDAGLPLSAETIKMISTKSEEIGKLFQNLRGQLIDSLKNPDLPSHMIQTVKNILNQLDNLLVKWNNTPLSMQENLQNVIQQMGHSLERDLANLVTQGKNELSAGSTESLLLSLAVLRSQLNQSGSSGLSSIIDNFIEQMRSFQFLNLPSQNAEQGHSEWVQLDLPLRFLVHPEDNRKIPFNDVHTARLRVAYNGSGKEREIDPDYTRLILQLDIKPGETIEVDLSIANRKIGALVTASSPELSTSAEEEFPSLLGALENVGYQVLSSRFVVGIPKPAFPLDRVNPSVSNATINELNVEA